jgi:ferric-dicitrate binding protein FerR (iron transport regulator)
LSQPGTPRRLHLLGLDDFELWRRRGVCLLSFTAALVVAYWVLWFTDRGIVASAHTASYVSFEQSFPLADGWLVAAALAAAIQGWRRRPSALLWLLVVGGAAFYLSALDVLYDLEHGIYTSGQGGAIELAINLATAAVGIGAIGVGWHFRREFLGISPDR